MDGAAAGTESWAHGIKQVSPLRIRYIDAFLQCAAHEKRGCTVRPRDVSLYCAARPEEFSSSNSSNHNSCGRRNRRGLSSSGVVDGSCRIGSVGRRQHPTWKRRQHPASAMRDGSEPRRVRSSFRSILFTRDARSSHMLSAVYGLRPGVYLYYVQTVQLVLQKSTPYGSVWTLSVVMTRNRRLA